MEYEEPEKPVIENQIENGIIKFLDIQVNGGNIYHGYIAFRNISQYEVHCFEIMDKEVKDEKNGKFEWRNVPETFGGMECPPVRVNRKFELFDSYTYINFDNIKISAIVSAFEYINKDMINVIVTTECKDNWDKNKSDIITNIRAPTLVFQIGEMRRRDEIARIQRRINEKSQRCKIQ